MIRRLTYGVITPAKDEETNLAHLGRCLAAQSHRPLTWLVVDDGSTDSSAATVSALAERYPWIRLISPTGGGGAGRGAPVVRAFHAGLEALNQLPDVVVKLDADITIPHDHFDLLIQEFERDPRLGIGGGACYEKEPNGEWRERQGTGPLVWGACRAYRTSCLSKILPLEEHMGWDTLDLMKASMKGWNVRGFSHLPFRHHRPEGERDGNRLRTYVMQGHGTYFMGYRLSYLALRTVFRSLRSPAAVGLLIGYGHARLKRRPRCGDLELREYIRSQQSLRKLPLRAHEALRPRAVLPHRQAG